MEIREFIVKFAEQFEETPVEEFTADAEFKEIEEWSSLSALIIIAMVDEEYGAKIKAEDIRNSETIEDLYKLVKSKI